MKRAVSLVLALVLCFAFAVPAAAADTAPKTAADLLNGLGLFKGAGTDANGAPEYQLDRPATRIEALVMLIRLIGREEEALAFTGPNPFNDVPAWADRYAAFAYSEKLATGRTPTTYDASGAAQAKDYLTFVLRALGYDDHSANPPFTYNDANSFAMKLGLVNHIYEDGTFLRGDAAVASACALKLKKNGSDTTLIQSLVTGGAVTPNAAHNAGFADVTAMPASEEGKKIEIAVDENGTITAEAVHAVLPQAKYLDEVSQSRFTAEYMERSGMPLEEYLQNQIARSVYNYNNRRELPCSMIYSDTDSSHWVNYACILDGDMNIIATHIMGKDPYGNGKITFTRTYVDTRSLYDKMMERVNASLANKDSLEVFVDVNDPHGGWDDGGGNGKAYHYPVYVNGKELTSEYRLSYNFVYEGWSIDDALINNQLSVLYSPPVMTTFDENGNPANIYHSVLSEVGMESETYDRLWDAQTGELVEEHIGLYTHEANFKEYDMIVIVYDTAGNVLGYTVI